MTIFDFDSTFLLEDFDRIFDFHSDFFAPKIRQIIGRSAKWDYKVSYFAILLLQKLDLILSQRPQGAKKRKNVSFFRFLLLQRQDS
jgi:hypothetical protein